MTEREQALRDAMRDLLAAQEKDLPEAYRKARIALKEYAPYPFCMSPEKCVGLGYCPREISCDN